jgi:ABC-type thiamine transport system substrate-binding protein
MINHTYVSFSAGANPTAFSYNASAVKIYNATNGIARFRIKIFSLL